ncbi:PLP-dependent aminotransferase family protein [Oceanobacter mangrovi]|uniref:aminotransferase-like domain-containing protein n=1 Tax=Oceanobacter mangrovi TaxID=2862510 RepID=UPI001C8E571C|nr:PLP-dependent aminotransferase family protein [Oceanobacter mangrovi]
MSAPSRSYRYQDLEQKLLQGIQQQRWRLGERLPSIRSLCEEFAASKATVQHALQRLEAQGLLEARPKSGFYVTLKPHTIRTPTTSARLEPPRPVNVSELLLDIMRRSAAFDILPGRPSGDLPPGIVALNRSIGRALRRQRGDDYLYYDDPAGLLALRSQLQLMLGRRGCALELDQIAITCGCQNALFLALSACCQPGDVVAVESPGFYGVMQLLQQLQLQVIEIPAHADSGMDIDALESALQQWPIKACVVSPAFATPTGALMPVPQRQQLLQLADQHDLAIVEDDIYADTAFNQIPDPLKALDAGPNGRVILCSSLSKSLSRDLRIGWVCGGRWHRQILQLKMITQLASSRSLQQGIADFIAEGHYSAHLKRQKYQLRYQRDQLLAYLRGWQTSHKISVPEGGLALWLEFGTKTGLQQPADTDALALYPKALQQKIVITPGPLFSASGQFGHCIRLSFAHDWNPQRLQALTTLRGLMET